MTITLDTIVNVLYDVHENGKVTDWSHSVHWETIQGLIRSWFSSKDIAAICITKKSHEYVLVQKNGTIIPMGTDLDAALMAVRLLA